MCACCRYAGLTQLPAGFVDMVKKFNPHITELELSRCVCLGPASACADVRKRHRRAAARHARVGLPAARRGHRSAHTTHVCRDACLPTRSNNLTDLPEDLEELRYLRILRVKYNQLKRLPAVVRP